MDDADPGGDGLARIGEADRAAIEQELARIGLVDAGQDLDQGRLARTILAQERMDRAGAQFQGDIGQGHHTRERLADAARREDGFGHAQIRPDARSTRTSRSRFMPTASRIRLPSTICTTNGSIWNRTRAWVMIATITTPRKVPATLT